MKTEVVVVGGGPAGLLLGYRLAEHGIGYRILERGRIAQSWRAMRPGMVLLSPSVPGTDWTSLTLAHPLWALPGVKRPFPTREDFLRYVDSFVREQELRIGESVAATIASVADGGFAVTTTAGRISCRFLVLASGASSVPRFPDIPGIAANPRVAHSRDFVRSRAYAEKRVLVVGGGNSAAEIAIELSGIAKAVLATRGPLRFFSETGELEDIRGSSESLLKELVRFGILRLREADPIVDVSRGQVRFLSGETEEYDVILFATGYLPKWIPVDGGRILAGPDGYPAISPVGETTVPGIYACGSLARFNRRCAFIHGFRNYVEKVFWDIADRR